MQANSDVQSDTILTDSVAKVTFATYDAQDFTGKKKRKRVERPQRIDREIMKTVFVPKGSWMAGGAVSYSEHEEDNLNFLVLKDVNALGYTFSVSPYVGYFSEITWQQVSVSPTTAPIWIWET